MIKIGVLGAKGRMGQWVCGLVPEEYGKKARLAAEQSRGASSGHLLETDVVIDFSSPEGMLDVAQTALKTSGPLPAFAVGSTGWKIEQRRVLEDLAQKTQVLVSSNFSTGVGALVQILKHASPMLLKLGYTPVIVETHHQHKKDAPSGTALSLQRAISPEGPGNVQTHSVRAGEIIGDHEVSFYGPGDHLTLGHFAQDRSIFARGAIEVALWLAAARAKGRRFGKLITMETYFQEQFK